MQGVLPCIVNEELDTLITLTVWVCKHQPAYRGLAGCAGNGHVLWMQGALHVIHLLLLLLLLYCTPQVCGLA